MSLFSKRVICLWTSNTVLHQCKIKSSRAKGTMRLFCTEVQIPKKTVRSMQRKAANLNSISWPLLVIPISAFALGTWQVKRMFWKENLIKELQSRTNLPVTDFPEDLDKIKELEYHPVRVRGKFDHSKEIYLGPRSLITKGSVSKISSLISTSGTGYIVITPFKLADRDLTILVNRGWVSSEKKLPGTRLEGQVEDEVELVGLVRHQETRKPLGMKNFPEKNFWVYKDIEKMSEVTGASPFLIDAVQSSSTPGGPIGGQTIVGLTNEHLTYIITWYTLSAITGFMWYSRFGR